MTNRFRRYLLLLLLFLPGVTACYTILKHPKVVQDDYTVASTERCIKCHSEEDLWYFHHPSNSYFFYGFYDPWRLYYDLPWWYDAYWFYEGSDLQQSDPPHRRSFRPRRAKEPSSTIRGKFIGPPFKGKSTGSSTKVKKKEKEEDEKAKEKEKKKRSLRPRRKKEKDR